MASSKKTAAGCGNIRKKIIRRGGKEYEYWEARYTVGFDPGTGKQVQKSVSGKTQKEVAQKLKAATAALDDGTYIAPNKMTVAQWLDTWQADYLKGVKPSTVSSLIFCATSFCVFPVTDFWICFPVPGSKPTVYRPSQ